MGLFGSIFGSNDQHPESFSVKKTLKLNKAVSGESAVSLDEIESKGGISLRKKTEAVGISLKKKNINGIRAQVVLLLDHSGSMYSDYENGQVQLLTERFLAFGLQVDEDGTIPVIPFDFSAKSAIDVNLSNFSNIVKEKIYKPREMGTTNLTDALKELKKIVETSDSPVYCGIITDGQPDDTNSTTQLIKELSQYPVFIKFLAIQKVAYLQDLDDLSDSERLLDNVDSKFFGNVSSVSDEDFADAMADEWDSWTKKATEKGVLS